MGARGSRRSASEKDGEQQWQGIQHGLSSGPRSTSTIDDLDSIDEHFAESV